MTFAVRRGHGPMFDNGIEFSRRRDEAEFIGMRISQSAINIDLVSIKAVCRFHIRIPKSIVSFLLLGGRSKQCPKNCRDLSTLILGPADNAVPIYGWYFGACFKSTGFLNRTRVVAPEREHVPCQILMCINN